MHKGNLEFNDNIHRYVEYTLEPMSSDLKDIINLKVPSKSLAMIITTSRNCDAITKETL